MKHDWQRVPFSEFPREAPYHVFSYYFTRVRRCQNCGKFQCFEVKQRNDVTGKLNYAWQPPAGRCTTKPKETTP